MRHETGELNGAFLTAAAATALIIIGSFGPWATTPLVNRYGLEVDGQLTILAGGLAAMLLWRYNRGPNRWQAAGVFLLAAVAAAVGIYDAADISAIEIDAGAFSALADVSVGWGLAMVCVAGVVGMLAAIGLWRSVPA